MKGDVIIIEEHHRKAAATIVNRYLNRISTSPIPIAVSVAGESGSGKSETGTAIKEELESRGISTFLFHQDDYFILPPKSNDVRRRQEISWVGPQEVRLDLLDEHLRRGKEKSPSVTKPLVDYDADVIEDETVNLSRYQVLVAEGTYTTLLKEADIHVFINRNRMETMESRRKRGREEIEPFLEEVLEIEHGIIAPHRERADVILTKDYEVTFPAG